MAIQQSQADDADSAAAAKALEAYREATDDSGPTVPDTQPDKTVDLVEIPSPRLRKYSRRYPDDLDPVMSWDKTWVGIDPINSTVTVDNNIVTDERDI